MNTLLGFTMQACYNELSIKVLQDYMTSLVPKSNLYSLPLMLVLPLPLLREFQPEAMRKDLANRLERHALDIRVEKQNEQPPNKTNTAVEPERAARRDPLHHAQESRRDDDVRAPAHNGVEHGAQRARLDGHQLRADPGDRCNTGGEEADVADDGDEHERARPADLRALDLERGQVDGDVAEGDGGDQHADGHAENGDGEEPPAAELVDEHEVEDGEDEVGAGDGDGDGRGIVEADDAEERRGVVHEGVEAAELADGHDDAGCEDGAAGLAVGEDAGEGCGEAFV